MAMSWQIDTLLWVFTLSCIPPKDKKTFDYFYPIAVRRVNHSIVLNLDRLAEKDFQFYSCYLEGNHCIFCVPDLADEKACLVAFFFPWKDNVVAMSCYRVWILDRQGNILRQYRLKKEDDTKAIIHLQPFRQDGSLNLIIEDPTINGLKLLTLTKAQGQWIEKQSPLPHMQCSKGETKEVGASVFIDTLSDQEPIYIKLSSCDSLFVYNSFTGIIQRFWVFRSYHLAMIDRYFVYGFYQDYWGVFDKEASKRKRKEKRVIKRYLMVHDKHTGKFLGAIAIPQDWFCIGRNWYESAFYFVDKKVKTNSLLRLQVYRLSVSPQ